MHRFTQPVLAIGIVAALYTLGSIGSRQTAARAAGGPAVTIESPIPLPVSGTVSAQQSGAWNVGILGQPLGVNINNSPTVINRNADDPVRIAYQSTADMSGKCSGSSCLFSFGAVPAGHRRVIQRIGGVVEFNQIPQRVSVLVVRAPNTFISSFLAPVDPAVPESEINEPLLFYLDQFQSAFIVVSVPLNAATFSGPAQILTLTGYEVDCNAVACAPIAQ